MPVRVRGLMGHGAVPAVGRIVLVGFMAAGKSTIGALLAKRIGWEFLDFDDRIQERTGLSAGQLIRERGEAAFRALEVAVTEEVAGRERMVLAPGGGWSLRPELLERLGSGTFRVWLKVSPEEVLRRADSDATDRPLLGPMAGRHERITELLERRQPFYQGAEVALDVDEREPDAVVEEIVRRLGFEGEDDER